MRNLVTQLLVPKFSLYDVIITSYGLCGRCIFSKKSTFFSFSVICDAIFQAKDHVMYQIIIFDRYMIFGRKKLEKNFFSKKKFFSKKFFFEKFFFFKFFSFRQKSDFSVKCRPKTSFSVISSILVRK